MEKEELIRKLRGEGFSQKTLEAFEKVDRREFVSRELEEEAYVDAPLPIGFNQTISQPYTIAFMLELLDVKEGQKILEIGSGSGYVLALLGEMNKTGEITGIEIVKELAEKSRERLKKHKNIKVIHGNGYTGLKNNSFDRILVSASASDIPKILLAQLKFKGVMAVPVQESIFLVKKEKGKNKVSEFPGFLFVPLIENGNLY